MKAEWQTKTLDQIAINLDSRRIPITKSVRVSGEYPYYGASGIVDFVADYIFDEDTLLISEDGANLLARSTPIAFPASGKYWVNNHAHILKFDYMTTQRFVELYLESIPLDGYITGAAQPKLNQKALNSIPIPIPPLPEQQRIVGILDEAFAGIAIAKANAAKNLQNARALFESHLQAVFSQRGEGWVETKLGDVCDLIDCLHKTPSYVESGFPMVRVTDIKSGSLDLSNTRRVDEKTFKEFSKKHMPRSGDIVFSRVGSYGVSSFVHSDELFCLGQNTVFIVPKINPRLLYYFLNSLIAKKQFDELVDGTTQPTISLKSIREVRVSIPPYDYS